MNPSLRDALPGLSRTPAGWVLAASSDAPRLELVLHQLDYRVLSVRPADAPWAGPGDTAVRRAQRALTLALRLPPTAGRNLDALLDSLRDLATWWPQQPRIAVVMHHCDTLARADPQGWQTLQEIFGTAADELQQAGDGGRRELVVVALDGPGARGTG